MSIFTDLLTSETITAVRTRIIAIAESADVAVTNWISGGIGEQIIQAMALAGYVSSSADAKVIRGFASLDTSTDPGDEDSYDAANESLTPVPGLLSAHGENTYGTPRLEETYATGFVTFTNGGLVSRTFGPESLTFTWTGGSPPTPAPTYRNTADSSIYTNPDGTVTVPAAGVLTFPIVAEQSGTGSNAPTGTLSLTTTMSGATATNGGPIAGTDREDATTYRARCRKASGRISLGGPDAAYQYLANTQLDGTALLNASSTEVNINRVQVSQESATGLATVAYASPAGAATAEDVTAANANIEEQSFAVPDCITFSGAEATEVNMTIGGTAKVKGGVGVDSDDAKAAIVAAIEAWFSTFPVGGVDQDVSGNGVMYTVDIQAEAAASYPGLYSVQVTVPAGASTALLFGRVAVPVTTVGDWTVTVT